MKKAPRVTTRIVADVDPKIRERLFKISKQKDKNMTAILIDLINIEYEFHFGKEN